MNRIFITSLVAFAGALALAPPGPWPRTRRQHVPLEKTIGEVTPTGPVPSLAVVNSDGAKLEGGKLVLTGVSKNAIVFADRPSGRGACHHRAIHHAVG